MTLIVGIGCCEGSFLVADSFTMAFETRFGRATTQARMWRSGKVDVLERAGIACVASGDSNPAVFEDFDAPDFETAARTVFERLTKVRSPVPSLRAFAKLGDAVERYDGAQYAPGELETDLRRSGRHQLICAELGTGRLAMLRDDDDAERESWFDHLYVGGAATEWFAQQRRPAPASTLAYAGLISRRIVSAFAWTCWRPNDYLTDQGLSTEWSGAPLMNPINGITITPDGHEVWQTWM